MLKIIIVPVFVVACLAIYAAVEEAVEWKLEKRIKPEYADQMRHDKQRLIERLKARRAAEQAIFEDIDTKARNPVNRFRYWLAGIIIP